MRSSVGQVAEAKAERDQYASDLGEIQASFSSLLRMSDNQRQTLIRLKEENSNIRTELSDALSQLSARSHQFEVSLVSVSLVLMLITEETVLSSFYGF